MEQRTKTTVAYRCPACGAILTFDVTRERLEKGKMNMPCIQCGKSHLDIMKEPSGSISLLVPCLMCPHPHPYKISPEMFFEKDIYCFPCSFTGIDICFIGDADYVDDEIIRSGREIADLIEETKEEDAMYPEEWLDERGLSDKEKYLEFYDDIKLTPKDDW